MFENLIYTISKDKHTKEALFDILSSNPQIKFVSLVGVDLSGNDTDEKIPVKLFLDDIDSFLHGVAVQTDGSSVVLPGIATLHDAKVDMIADLDCNWFVDYNFDKFDEQTEKPIGTLKIPCFLYHTNKPVGSRYLLKSSIDTFVKSLNELLEKNPSALNSIGINPTDIKEILVTSATELEFWVQTPEDTANIEALSASQVLHEHYWTKTKGDVRTALEETLILMDLYGFEPEMGHKEVGGVKAKLSSDGNYAHVMEQLEIDWKYSSALQAADNELFIRALIQETYRRYGLDVTFMAKPIDDVAGSGMHVHLGISARLNNGKIVNLFHVNKDHYLSEIGYGALMGLLNNYEIMNPFISSTNNALKRLKPGFEAPICTVTSLGESPENPSRNRTILIGLVRDIASPLATRFELRSPNPHSNTYLTMAVSYLAMLDGVIYALDNKKSQDELLKELSKKPGEKFDYLRTDRAYRTELDVFEHYTEEERVSLFGKAPATIYENLKQLDDYKEKLSILRRNPIFTDQIIDSFRMGTMEKWIIEIEHRVINKFLKQVRDSKMLHDPYLASDLDLFKWSEISNLRVYIMKDSFAEKSLFTRLKTAFESNDLETASNLYIELEEKMSELRNLYSSYEKNLLDI